MKKLKNIILVLVSCLVCSAITGYITWARTSSKLIGSIIDGAFYHLSESDSDLNKKVTQLELVVAIEKFSEIPDFLHSTSPTNTSDEYKSKTIETKYTVDQVEYNQRKISLTQALETFDSEMKQEKKEQIYQILDQHFIPMDISISGDGLNELFHDIGDAQN